jgi:hypothetical protein
MIGMKLSGRLRSAAGVLGRVLGVCAAAVAVSAGLSAEEVTENPETDAQFAETLQELLEDGEAHWF